MADVGKELDLQWWLAPGASAEARSCKRQRLLAEPRADSSPAEWLESPVLQSMPDADLVGLLLAGASDPHSTQAARELLERVQGLRGLLASDERTLSLLSLSGPASTRLVAARELACRLACLDIPEVSPLSHEDALVRYISLRYAPVAQEVLGVLFLRPDRQLIAVREIYRGAAHRCSIDPAPILREGLLLKAWGLVVFLTRPGGKHELVQADRDAARLIEIGSEAVGLMLVDFLVVADAGHWSSVFSERD